jgi:asparagine synthetase B (glutamine-hydrolysing)
MTAARSHLTIANLYWDGDAFAPPIEAGDPATLAARLERLEGQFALVLESEEGAVLVRDKHGVNKLFYAIREDGTLLVANYVLDLVDRGVPFDAVFSVPSGHYTRVDAQRQELENVRYYRLPEPREQALEGGARAIRAALELWFSRMARAFGNRAIRLCLSGGLDSSVIAALAARHFDDLTAYTYSYVEDDDGDLSEDARYATRIAETLGMPLRLVKARREDLGRVARDALVHGQDWRDFNVHCAVVNELLAEAMAADAPPASQLVLTGDMMNEILADYTPISYAGVDYYRLPQLPPEKLRRTLVRGLDAGDREVGVFARHGIDLVQPYGLVLDHYLRIPLSKLGEAQKQNLVREVAGDLLPEFVLGRKKVRAQIGDSEEPSGILPLFVAQGWDSAWLVSAWCERFGIEDADVMGRFLRGGVYRAPVRWPGSRIRSGYLAG